MARLKVVIADDQPMMRAGFKAVLEATGDIEVVPRPEPAPRRSLRPNSTPPTSS